MHDLPLQPPLRCIARHRFASRSSCRLVIGTNPWGEARVRHFASDIGVDGSKELIMHVFLVACGGGYYRVDDFGKFDLVKSAYARMVRMAMRLRCIRWN